MRLGAPWPVLPAAGERRLPSAGSSIRREWADPLDWLALPESPSCPRQWERMLNPGEYVPHMGRRPIRRASEPPLRWMHQRGPTLCSDETQKSISDGSQDRRGRHGPTGSQLVRGDAHPALVGGKGLGRREHSSLTAHQWTEMTQAQRPSECFVGLVPGLADSAQHAARCHPGHWSGLPCSPRLVNSSNQAVAAAIISSLKLHRWPWVDAQRSSASSPRLRRASGTGGPSPPQ